MKTKNEVISELYQLFFALFLIVIGVVIIINNLNLEGMAAFIVFGYMGGDILYNWLTDFKGNN